MGSPAVSGRAIIGGVCNELCHPTLEFHASKWDERATRNETNYPDEPKDAGEAPPSRKLAAQSGWNLGDVRPQVDTTARQPAMVLQVQYF
jgi:hypothetical protein